MRKITLFLVIALFAFCSEFVAISFAQSLIRIEVPSSFNPVGQGARALGMGGAFIAVADDATAASWNPAGLVQLERPEVSIVGGAFHRTEDNDFSTNPEASGSQRYSKNRINYMSATYPFTLFGRNIVVSANWQNLYDLNREWDFPLFLSADNLSIEQDVDYKQDGALGAWGLASALQITPNLSLGVTVNIWEDGIEDNEWKQKTRQNGSGDLAGNAFTFQSESIGKFDFSGWNANLGVLWNATGKLTIGGVLKTPFTADIDSKISFNSEIQFPDSPGANTSVSTQVSDDLDLDMPMSVGLGVAYRFSDNFTASFDIYRTSWDDFELETSDGTKISPITGRPANDSDIDATYQARLGAEYLFISDNFVIPVRAGVFYDPAPAEGSPDDFYGLSLGSGIGFGPVIIDVSYQFRWGNDVGEYILEDFEFSQDVREHTVYASMIVHF